MSEERAGGAGDVDGGKAYGEAYLRWKSWGGEAFGLLSPEDESSFDIELGRTGRAWGPSTRVLEIGFGNGSFLSYAARQGWAISATEVNAGLVEVAQKNGIDARLTQDLSVFADQAFDLIVAFDVLEHIPQDLLPGFFAQIRRLLTDQGCLVARFPNGDSPFGLPYQHGDVTHVTTLGSIKVRFFGAGAGLTEVYVGGSARPVSGHGWRSRLVRAVKTAVRRMVDRVVNKLFLAGGDVAFSSPNLTAIFRAAPGR